MDPSKGLSKDDVQGQPIKTLPSTPRDPQSVRDAGIAALRTLYQSSPQASLVGQEHDSNQQLNAEGDEFVLQEYDEVGEEKIDMNGSLRGGRQYNIRTFTLSGRGEKLFMLAPECARTFGYRDSYLLFNRNKSLYRIVAQSNEKQELVDLDILPLSYLTRQVAIVTARSIFLLFGCRAVKDGQRVRDDYWEAKERDRELNVEADGRDC